jgi:hypothetical protein
MFAVARTSILFSWSVHHQEPSMAGIRELRRELDAAMAIPQYSAYPKRLDELRKRFKHNITVLSQHGNFNCFAYAFGLSNHRDFVSLVYRTQKTAVMNSDFVVELLASGRLRELDEADAETGSMALYFLNGTLTHAAIVRHVNPLLLESKWGPSELHSHGLWEVPASYGDEVRFFAATEVEELLDDLFEREGLND